MSTLRTYNLQNPDSSNVNIELTQGSGAVVAGVTTFSSNVRVSGNLNVDGELTYEDVTNIDSVGIITARRGIVSSGVVTATSFSGNLTGNVTGNVTGNADTATTATNAQGLTGTPNITVGTVGCGNVTSSGIGIGTDTSGSTKLKIESGSGTRAISLNAPTNGTYITFETAGTAYADIGAEKGVVGSGSADTPVINARGSRDLAFRTNSSEKLRITSAGDMGLGTATPTQFGPTLQVAGTDPALLLQDTATAVDYFGVNVASGAVNTWYDDAAAFTINTASAISGAGLAEKLRIDSAGRVMIGAQTPGPTAGEQLTIADSLNAGITIRSGTTAAGSILFEDDTADRGEIQYSHNGDYMRFKTAGTERLRIASDGQATFDKGAVGGANQVIARFQAESSRRLDIVWHDSGSLLGFDLPGSHSYIFKTNGTERLRINNNGNLDIRSGGSLSVTDSNGNASGQASTTGAINCNLIRPYNNSNSSWNGVYFLSRNAVGGGAKSVGIVETGLRVGSFSNDLSATERIKLGTNGIITADTNTTDGVVANLRNDEVALQIGVYGTGSSYARQCTINATRRDSGSYPWLRLAGQDGIYFCSDLNNVRGSLNAYGEWRLGVGNNNLISTDHSHSIGNIGVYNTTNAARLQMQERAGIWISFKNGSGVHYGSISQNSPGVLYGSNSDYRLKDNVQNFTGGIELVKRLRPVTFNWNALSGQEDTTTTQRGFLAHEVQEIEPGAVDGVKDEMDRVGDCTNAEGVVTQKNVYESQAKDGETWTLVSEEIKDQQLDPAKLVPILTAALQEVIAKNEALEARIAALEG